MGIKTQMALVRFYHRDGEALTIFNDVNGFSRACEDSLPISNDGIGAQSSCRR